jgi:hypothetical protein
MLQKLRSMVWMPAQRVCQRQHCSVRDDTATAEVDGLDAGTMLCQRQHCIIRDATATAEVDGLDADTMLCQRQHCSVGDVATIL